MATSTEPGSAPETPALPPGARVVAVSSLYHAEIVDRMAAAALAEFVELGLDPASWETFHAPGAFELPVLAQRAARRDDVDAVLCFGLVLKGETEHDRFIADSVAHALQRVALENDKPVAFGVLTTSTVEQAERRSRPAAEGGLDKGREVARAVAWTLAGLRAAGGAGPDHTPYGRSER